MNTINKTAKTLYEAYCKAVGGAAHDGSPLPDWEAFVLDGSKQKQSDAWVEAASVSVEIGACVAERIVSNKLEKLAITDGDILLVSVPRNVAMDPYYLKTLTKVFASLVCGRNARVLVKNEDMGFDVLADLLSPDDVAAIVARMERKKLTKPVSPEQNRR